MSLFGEDIVLDFNDFSKYSFLYRKGYEFKAKEFKPRIIIDYYCDTLDIVNANILIYYTNKNSIKQCHIKRRITLKNGQCRFEYRIPFDINQLQSIEIAIYDHESPDDRYTLRIDDIFFLNDKKTSE